jgi:UDP-N-acetylmuramate--alanine ligase
MYNIDFEKKLSVHFIGIGGISMSGLAEILLKKGFSVSGSDRSESDLTNHLVSLGAKISYPQQKENITNDTDFFVYTAAIHPDNPEFKAASETGKPMLTRAELLGQLMDHFKQSIAVAGTHGKTTTTSMISQVLLECEADPTISVGAIFSAIKSNVRYGESDIFVTEACEYTDSFLSFYPKYNIILNIDAEHLDYFKTLENERLSYHKFATNTKEDGVLYINGSIPNLEEITHDLKCKITTFGLDDSYDYYATNISYDELGHATFTPVAYGKELPEISLHVPGKHNVSNALSVIATMIDMNIPYEMIQRGLKAFTGADRRFQYKGRLKNGAVVVDDYAHHPTEIKASLDAALHTPHNRIIVAFQPHTYTRTKAFLQDFADALSMADIVVLAKIYAAREQDIYGVSSAYIQKLIQEKGKECHYFETFEEIENFLEKNSMNQDLLITMGAGNIIEVGENLIGR